MDSSNSVSPFDGDFDQLADKLLKDFCVPGLSIAVVDGDKVFTKGYGFADVSSSTEASPETLYYIGSITKNMFATTLTKYIQAQEEGTDKITLQTPLVDLIRDDFVLQDQWANNHITFEDVLCHRTGMARNNLIYGGSCKTVKDVTRAMRHLSLSTEPRFQYDYCNIMFSAATHAIEAKTNEPLSNTMRKLIFEPLGMRDTHTTRQAATEHGHDKVRLYNGYVWHGKHFSGGKGSFVQAEHIDLGCTGGAGFVISNVLDMSKYIKAWLGYDGLLSKEIRTEVSRPRVIISKSEWNDEYGEYALGLDRRTYQGVEVISHLGGLTGYTSVMSFVPAMDFGFIALGNSITATKVGQILFYHLLHERLQVDKDKRFDFAANFENEIKNSKMTKTLDEAAKEHYPSLREKVLPLVLPLSDYTGTFHNAAYRAITFEVRPGTNFSNGKQYLEATVPDRAWPFVLHVFHVSGDYWIVKLLNGLEEHEGRDEMVFKATVKYGVDGTVKEWGLEIEPSQQRKNWIDKLIWFTRE